MKWMYLYIFLKNWSSWRNKYELLCRLQKIKITTYVFTSKLTSFTDTNTSLLFIFCHRISVVLDFLDCKPCTFINPPRVTVYSLISRFQTVIIIYTSFVKIYYTICTYTKSPEKMLKLTILCWLCFFSHQLLLLLRSSIIETDTMLQMSVWLWWRLECWHIIIISRVLIKVSKKYKKLHVFVFWSPLAWIRPYIPGQ